MKRPVILAALFFLFLIPWQSQAAEPAARSGEEPAAAVQALFSRLRGIKTPSDLLDVGRVSAILGTSFSQVSPPYTSGVGGVGCSGAEGKVIRNVRESYGAKWHIMPQDAHGIIAAVDHARSEGESCSIDGKLQHTEYVVLQVSGISTAMCVTHKISNRLFPKPSNFRYRSVCFLQPSMSNTETATRLCPYSSVSSQIAGILILPTAQGLFP
jgi:hypothetical protein